LKNGIKQGRHGIESVKGLNLGHGKIIKLSQIPWLEREGGEKEVGYGEWKRDMINRNIGTHRGHSFFAERVHVASLDPTR
jgi:hypothetical protein